MPFWVCYREKTHKKSQRASCAAQKRLEAPIRRTWKALASTLAEFCFHSVKVILTHVGFVRFDKMLCLVRAFDPNIIYFHVKCYRSQEKYKKMCYTV